MIPLDFIRHLVEGGLDSAAVLVACKAFVAIPRPLDNGATSEGPSRETETRSGIAGGPTASVRRSDPTATARQQRRREKVKAERSQLDLPLAAIVVNNDAVTLRDGVTERDGKRDANKERKVSTPSKERNYIHDDDDARVVSMITLQAHTITEQLKAIAGVDPDPMACPPGWCGAPLQVQSWLNEGVTPDAMLIGARTVMSRKRDGPPATVAYFGPEIAKVAKKGTRPLPDVKISEDAHARPHNRPSASSREEAILAGVAAAFGLGDDQPRRGPGIFSPGLYRANPGAA